MVDMGQADRTLRMRPLKEQHQMCWTVALKKAAEKLGYDQYMLVPDEREEELRKLAHSIRNGEVT